MLFFLSQNRNNAVVPTLADILRDTGKEKVIRIILATLRVRKFTVLKLN